MSNTSEPTGTGKPIRNEYVWECPSCGRVTVMYIPAMDVSCPGTGKHLTSVWMKLKGKVKND